MTKTHLYFATSLAMYLTKITYIAQGNQFRADFEKRQLLPESNAIFFRPTLLHIPFPASGSKKNVDTKFLKIKKPYRLQFQRKDQMIVFLPTSSPSKFEFLDKRRKKV